MGKLKWNEDLPAWIAVPEILRKLRMTLLQRFPSHRAVLATPKVWPRHLAAVSVITQRAKVDGVSGSSSIAAYRLVLPNDGFDDAGDF
jgi:hypothetical protein